MGPKKKRGVSLMWEGVLFGKLLTWLFFRAARNFGCAPSN